MKCALLSLLILIGAAASFSAAAAPTVPALKPGLWQTHVQSPVYGSHTPPSMTVCYGAMSDQQRQLENDNIKNRCSKYESREVDGKWVVDAVCTARGRTITKHVVTSLSGDSFHEENTAPQGTMTTEGKWLGPCKPGQKPDAFK